MAPDRRIWLTWCRWLLPAAAAASGWSGEPGFQGAGAPHLSPALHFGRMVKTKGAKNKEAREAGTPYDLKQTAKEEAVDAARKRSQPTLLQLFGKKDSAITPVPQASGSSSTASSVAISSQDPVRKLVVVYFPVSGRQASFCDGNLEWTVGANAASFARFVEFPALPEKWGGG